MDQVNFIDLTNNGIPRHLTVKEFSYFQDAEIPHLEWDGKILSFDQVSFDWETKLKYHASQHYSLKKEPLARALGFGKGHEVEVIDATLGSGKDSMLMLSYGAKVLARERNPVVYLLTLDALSRVKTSEQFESFFHNFEVQFGAVQELSSSACRGKVFYYDPMFPQLRNKSKSKKEMELFKTLVGPDQDIASVFDWACAQPFSRLVFKQSSHDQPLGRPTNTYKGKSVNYHMYQF